MEKAVEASAHYREKSLNLQSWHCWHCSPVTMVTLPNANIVLHILTAAQPERVFSKVEKTASATRASISEYRLEALVLIQTHRDKTSSIDDVIFAANTTSSPRRFVLLLNLC